MYHRFSADEMGRLLKLVDRVAMDRDCDATAAIEYVEATVEGGERPLHIFADGLRRGRARRKEILGRLPFRDPVWDMLLDLYIAHCRGGTVSVSALCYGSGVPPTTALRYLDQLERKGHVHRTPDARDSRRCFVTMAHDMIEPIERVLRSIVRYS